MGDLTQIVDAGSRIGMPWVVLILFGITLAKGLKFVGKKLFDETRGADGFPVGYVGKVVEIHCFAIRQVVSEVQMQTELIRKQSQEIDAHAAEIKSKIRCPQPPLPG